MPKVSDEYLAEMPSECTLNGHDAASHHHPPDNSTNNNTGGTMMDEFFSSIKKDAEATVAFSERLTPDMVKDFVDIIEKCEGTLITSGIGKSGIIAQRMSTSLSSTGTPAHYVNGAEWTHGDLGKARRGDVCVFFSHSGNTRECVFAVTHLQQRGVHILSIIGNERSKLAGASDAYICYEIDHELDEPIGGVPTTSIILQEMVINAVVCELISRRRFTKIEFARNHPGGCLGVKLRDLALAP